MIGEKNNTTILAHKEYLDGRLEVVDNIMKVFTLTLVSLYCWFHFEISRAVPVNACTFFKDPFGPCFEECSEPTTKQLSCKFKTIGPWWARVPIQGDHVEMYLPEYLIEVTPHAGKSAFISDSFESTGLKNHMEFASNYFAKQKIIPTLLTSGGGRHRRGRANFWHARILQIPYGSILNSTNVVNNPKATAAIPLCFIGISELVFEQWMQGKIDRPISWALSPLIHACRYKGVKILNEIAMKTNALESAQELLSGLPTANSAIPLPDGCAYPINLKFAAAQNITQIPDFINPLNQCIGPLGSVLPRKGLIPHENKLISAHAAAWKFASLVETAYPFGPGITKQDKWQLMYPKSLKSSCYNPASLLDGLGIKFPKDPLPSKNKNLRGAYIFAIWRKHSACIAPGTGAAWLAQMQVEISAKRAMCPVI